MDRHQERFEGSEEAAELAGPHPMTVLLVVMAAGAVGVAARYLLGALVTQHAGDGFPWSTLLVNVAGAFAMGVLIAVLERHELGSDLVRPAIGIGLLGGFTTFSAFALETVTLVEDGYLGRAVAYVGATNTFGIGALVAGLAVARSGRGATAARHRVQRAPASTLVPRKHPSVYGYCIVAW